MKDRARRVRRVRMYRRDLRVWAILEALKIGIKEVVDTNTMHVRLMVGEGKEERQRRVEGNPWGLIWILG